MTRCGFFCPSTAAWYRWDSRAKEAHCPFHKLSVASDICYMIAQPYQNSNHFQKKFMIDNSSLQHYNQAKLFGETGAIPVRARRREAHTVPFLPEAAFGDKPLRSNP